MEGMAMQAVGVYLRTLRNDLKLTQDEAGDKIGVVAKTIERWEAGDHEPKLTQLAAYVHALGGSVSRAVSLLIDYPERETKNTPDELAAINRLSPERKKLVLDLIDQLGRDA
jgi:transcriptional regulator with XRE-family HTH domain